MNCTVFENPFLNRTADPYFSPRFLKMFASASFLSRSAIAAKCVISSSRYEIEKGNFAAIYNSCLKSWWNAGIRQCEEFHTQFSVA